MTGNAYESGDVLARLCKEFEYRGVRNPKVINRVSLQKNGSVKKTRRANAMAKDGGLSSSRIIPGLTSAKKQIPGRDYLRYDREPDLNPNGEEFVDAYDRGRNIRNAVSRFNPEAYEKNVSIRRERAKKQVKKVRAKKSFAQVLFEKLSEMRPRRSDAAASPDERFVKRSSIPKGAVAVILLCTVLVLVMLYTYSSYAEVVSEGRELQSENVDLQETRSRLINHIELRDDIRKIEDYATNTIGMVKSDLVETRSVKIAGGERMEIIKADTQEESGGFFSTILSALGTNFERLWEYID